MSINELVPERLRLACPPNSVECETTKELTPVEGIIGQERALKALKFATEMRGKGFNVYVAGVPSTGKRPATRSYLEGVAKTKPTPSDWVYVNNFRDSYEPRALSLPPGKGRPFQRDLKSFIIQVGRAVPAALQSEDFASQTNAITKRSVAERDKILN